MNGTLESTVSALSKAVKQSRMMEKFTENQDSNAPSLDVFELCGEAARCTPGCGDEFWHSLGCEITAAVQEMAAVRSSLEAECDAMLLNRDQRIELELLCGVSQTCVHVGVLLTQLLLPTAVDPVFMAHTEYNCYQLLVSGVNVYTEIESKESIFAH